MLTLTVNPLTESERLIVGKNLFVYPFELFARATSVFFELRALRLFTYERDNRQTEAGGAL